MRGGAERGGGGLLFQGWEIINRVFKKRTYHIYKQVSSKLAFLRTAWYLHIVYYLWDTVTASLTIV